MFVHHQTYWYFCSRLPNRQTRPHISCAHWTCVSIIFAWRWELHTAGSVPPVDDVYLHIELGCVPACDLQWVESIGMANNNAILVTLMDLAKWFKAYWSQFFFLILTDLLYLQDIVRVPQMPRAPNLLIFVLTNKTDRTDCFSPCVLCWQTSLRLTEPIALALAFYVDKQDGQNQLL